MNLDIYALFMPFLAQLLYRRAEIAWARGERLLNGTLVTAVASTCNKLQGSFKRNPSLVLHVTATNPNRPPAASTPLPLPPFAGRLPSRGAEQVTLAF